MDPARNRSTQRIALSLLLLSCCASGGCAWFKFGKNTAAPVIVRATSAPQCVHAPPLLPLQMLPTQIQLISDRDGVVWIALDAQGYENLSRNIGSLRLALGEARSIIGYYADCVRGDGGQATDRRPGQ